jgi:hypothetical protein
MSDTRTMAGGQGDQRGVADRARDVADRGKHDAADVARVARSETAELAHRTTSEARRRADEQAGKLASMLGGLAEELDQVASTSSARGGNVAGVARDGAAVSRRVAERLDQGGVDGVLDDVRRFARRRPAMFLAASFGVGLVLGRFTRNADLAQLAQDSRDAGSGNGDEFASVYSPTSGSGAGASSRVGNTASTGAGTTVGGQPGSGMGTASAAPITPSSPTAPSTQGGSR